MGNSCISPLFFLIFLASLATASQSNNFHHLPPKSKPKVALFVFGDSLYDPGNNNYINTTSDFQANFLPYGETFFEFGTGRFSDGRLMPDFIGQQQHPHSTVGHSSLLQEESVCLPLVIYFLLLFFLQLNMQIYH